MADTTLPGVLLKGVAASRPAASAVAKGTIYSATDTGAITQSDGSSWSTYATISSGMADPMTTRGDIIIRNSSNTTARLAIGTSGKVLQSDGTDISWQTPSAVFSGAKAYHSTTQSIPNSTVTAASLDSEEFDTDTYHSTVTNTSRMTIPSGKDGYFLLAGKVVFAANATGVRIARFLKNGTTILRTQYSDAGASGAGKSAQISAVASLIATDYVEFTVYQTSGGALNIGNASASEEQTSFEIVRLGA